MGSQSREYAKFKRMFVGPKYPRSIRKKRETYVPPRTPVVRLFLDKSDIRRVLDRIALTKLATPNWADVVSIKKLYEKARCMTIESGINYEVDHIIPIKHPLVCGLHVENNLSIIPAFENNIKSNIFTIE